MLLLWTSQVSLGITDWRHDISKDNDNMGTCRYAWCVLGAWGAAICDT